MTSVAIRTATIGAAAIEMVALAAATLLGAPSASAAGAPKITVEYDATSVTINGDTQPSLIVRGAGFSPAPAGTVRRVIEVDNRSDRDNDNYRVALDPNDTLERKVCTHTVPSSCIVQYQAGELRPVRMFLGDGTVGRGRAAVCGDLLTVSVHEIPPVDPTVLSNVVRFVVPCDTYTPRPPRRIP